ncbi:epoxide hydrolase [Nocardia seriolae]|uniref:Epoxide hydrolase n=2 Tax=Nocardia seriolae TaxID=37332 RepID=A0ABC9Z5C3_9NOCA|nr:hypothetical protein NSER024013_70910 [Nocardia seriolae]GAM50858.1 epoxide hydrolase [Nocardia seriolae]GAP32818.1 epoxide hydrolase [Nocardia seriolae]
MTHTVVAMSDTAIHPFRIDIPQSDLDDLEDRLARARSSAQLPGQDWDRGVPVACLRELADYWRTEFDWCAKEAELNAYPQFQTEIYGLNIHFLHIRSTDPDALPLILTHRWPNTFVEFTKTIPLLTNPTAHGMAATQAFHLVIPSVLGFGFSEAPRKTGTKPERVARTWVELMARLGYDRYGVQGGDLGAYVVQEMAIADPAHIVGVHIDGGIGLPTEADIPTMTAEELAEWDLMQKWQSGVNHHVLLNKAPQTFAHAGTDSPSACWPGWSTSSTSSPRWQPISKTPSTATTCSPTSPSTGSPILPPPPPGPCTTAWGTTVSPGPEGSSWSRSASTPAAPH